VNTVINFLKNYFSDKTINLIITSAIEQQVELYFLNRLTCVPQPLTMVQLAGIKKFGGVSVLLETGQTYQIGLIMEQTRKGTYQEVRLADLIVDEETLNKIKKEY
jgi:hypothetical protein